jgi:hypothetical protein
MDKQPKIVNCPYLTRADKTSANDGHRLTELSEAYSAWLEIIALDKGTVPLKSPVRLLCN